MNESKRHGTRYFLIDIWLFLRIFKKSTPNGKVTVYLGKRDFVDHLTHVDPIEGVVLVDAEYVKGRKVFIHLLCAFRHGRDGDEFHGIDWHRDLFLNTKQVYPPPGPADESTLHSKISRLQERLIRKLGPDSYPFTFKLPTYTPASVSLLLHSSDVGKPCRVDYELKVYVVDEDGSRVQKRNSVRMIVRKLTFAPDEAGPQPTTEVVRDFLMSLGSLRVEASLDKQKYFHGESIVVNVLVDNNSTKTVKKIKLIVRQYTVICLPNASHYKCNVAEISSEEGFPIWPSQTGWCKVYCLCPLLADNRDKSGLALDGDLKNEDTNLASSTIVPTNSSREALGIVVQYKVKIRLVLGFGLSDVCLELPFILTHPNPETGATTPGSGAEGAGDGLEDFHFTEAGRAGDESSGGEGVEGPALPALPPQAPQPLTLNGGAGASRPQMGLLAKRAAGGGCAGSNSRGPKSPPNSHIAEFLHASEMPDGMAAFAPPPPSATGASTDAADVLETFLGMLEFPPPSNSSGHSNGMHPQGHPPPSSPATSSAPAISSTQGAASTNKCQQMDADDLIFEDFARLRLMQQQQQRHQGQRTAP
ncbi:beta arrestin 1 [Echinococcus multilocularis]|uniref:Beta arrestin 1 n=1 Tax=Echinococcus multilocularis TaxID=6211 RepID=A0A087W0P7_ECHMU|nr:beta arrestin 1 [Echinococcus multilocularis]